MAFRFNLHGVDVECDTVEELQRALLGAGALGTKQPTTTQQRARKLSGNGRRRPKPVPDVLGNSTRRPIKTGGAHHSWNLAKIYGSVHNMSPGKARSYLTDHPEAREEAERLLQKGR